MNAQYRYIEWDEGNLWKNEIKHGVTAEEIEQCFNNPPFTIFPHKKISDRRMLLGRTFGGRRLFVVFQHKSGEVARPISPVSVRWYALRIEDKVGVNEVNNTLGLWDPWSNL